MRSPLFRVTCGEGGGNLSNSDLLFSFGKFYETFHVDSFAIQTEELRAEMERRQISSFASAGNLATKR